MSFTLDASEHLFDIVEAADKAWPQVEASGSKRRPRLWLLELVESGAQRVVDNPLERLSTLSSQLFEAGGNVFFQCQCRAHAPMPLMP